MINLFLSEPIWNDVGHDDSAKLRILLLNELESVIWSVMMSGGRAEARLWLCNTIAGMNCITPHHQRELFVNLLRTLGPKHGLVSQLLHMMFEKMPQNGCSILAQRSYVLAKFFEGNAKRILQWFSYSYSSDSGLEQGKGFRALSQFAFKNRDICWEELEWKGKHGQSPAMVATKPHYFLDLDIQRTVENFIENVPEFWSSGEFVDSLEDGDIFFIDRSFFVRYFIDLMYKEESKAVWEFINKFLTEQSFSSLCHHLLITLEEQDLCYFLELLCRSLSSRTEFKHFNDVSHLFEIVLLKCGSSGSIDQILLLNAVITHGRHLQRLLCDEEAQESRAKINEIVSKISAIPSNGNSLTPIFRNTCKMTVVEVIKCLGLQSWVLYYRLFHECRTSDSWESVFMNNGIGFRNTNNQALLDLDRPSKDCSGFDCSASVVLQNKKKQKARKRRRRTYDHDDGFDNELLDFDAPSRNLDLLLNTGSWLLSTDEYSSKWNSADLPEHLHRYCLSMWMACLFRK